jgi:hypothetical protein
MKVGAGPGTIARGARTRDDGAPRGRTIDMPGNGPRFEDRLNEAGKRIEDELRRVVRYIDDEVVPEVRRNGSTALRSAAARLQELAQRMDDNRPPSAPADRGKP